MLLASISSILQTHPDFKTLEQSVYTLIAAQVREELRGILTAIDAELMARRPPGLRHRGSKSRMLETRFGPQCIHRRRYLEILPTGERRWRYLLDEALGLPADVQVSPGVRAQAIETALQVSYRQAAELMEAAHPDGRGPSHGSIHRWLCVAGEQRVAWEETKTRELFEAGVLPAGAGQRIAVLFAEADELRVALQRPKRRRTPGQRLPKRGPLRGEVRLLVCHRGWIPRDPGSAEYRVQDKHLYATIAEAETFWRGATLSLHGYCALEQVRCTLLNGDGASWIRQGRDYLPSCEFQLDRWHLQQALKAGLDWHPRARQRLRDQIAAGAAWSTVERVLTQALRQAPDAQTTTAVRRLRTYLWENRDGLVDYRQRALPVPPDAAWRGLGIAESNVDKPWANRLTKRGMSWSTGLRSLVRLLNLHEHGTLQAWLEVSGGWKPVQEALYPAVAAVHRTVLDSDDGRGRQARLPALAGPTQPLTRTLRRLRQERLDV